MVGLDFVWEAKVKSKIFIDFTIEIQGKSRMEH